MMNRRELLKLGAALPVVSIFSNVEEAKDIIVPENKMHVRHGKGYYKLNYRDKERHVPFLQLLYVDNQIATITFIDYEDMLLSHVPDMRPGTFLIFKYEEDEDEMVLPVVHCYNSNYQKEDGRLQRMTVWKRYDYVA